MSFQKTLTGMVRGFCLAMAGVCLITFAAADDAPIGADESFFDFFQYRALGPARQGGRILDIIAVEGNPKVFYVAAASGGVWKTVNNGTTFEPVFDGNGILAKAESSFRIVAT